MDTRSNKYITLRISQHGSIECGPSTSASATAMAATQIATHSDTMVDQLGHSRRRPAIMLSTMQQQTRNRRGDMLRASVRSAEHTQWPVEPYAAKLSNAGVCNTLTYACILNLVFDRRRVLSSSAVDFGMHLLLMLTIGQLSCPSIAPGRVVQCICAPFSCDRQKCLCALPVVLWHPVRSGESGATPSDL
jgi:hypothetical protein